MPSTRNARRFAGGGNPATDSDDGPWNDYRQPSQRPPGLPDGFVIDEPVHGPWDDYRQPSRRPAGLPPDFVIDQPDDWQAAGRDDWIPAAPATSPKYQNPIAAEQDVAREALSQIGRGAQQFTGSFDIQKPGQITPWEAVKRLGYQEWERIKAAYNVGSGVSNYVTAPIGGLIRSGAKLATGAASEVVPGAEKLEPYVEFAGHMAVPALGLSKFGPARDLPAVAPKPPPIAPTARAAEDIGGQLAREGRLVRTPGEAGAEINAGLGEAAQTARQTQRQANELAEGEAAAHKGIQEDQGRAIAEALRGAYPELESSREAGELVGQGVREAAQRERQGFQNLYGQAFSKEGNFHAGALEGVGQRVKGYLSAGDNPVIIDDVTTPVANRAVTDLDRIGGLRIQNAADPLGAPDPSHVVAVDLRGVDQARKRLVQYYSAARRTGDPADIRATGQIINAFDHQVENAISGGLFRGDPTALDALQKARGAYSDYARKFRPQFSGDDAGNAIRRIVDRNATPEEISNMILGSGRFGSAGAPVRIASRLKTILGEDSEGWNAIRQAMWKKASDPRMPSGSIDPIKAANRIGEFSNSSLGRAIFSPEELDAFKAHAQGVRDLDATLANLASTKTAQTSAADFSRLFSGEGIGGGQATAFRKIVEGTATPEETAHAIFGAIGSGGNPGNISRLITSIKRISGDESDAMSAIRQGVWQRLTQDADDFSKRVKMADAIRGFVHGRGMTIANQLFDMHERDLMLRYADAARTGANPRGLSRLSRTIINMVGHKLGVPHAGHAVDWMLKASRQQ